MTPNGMMFLPRWAHLCNPVLDILDRRDDFPGVWTVLCRSASDLMTLGRVLGEVASSGWTIALRGELGAGKTCFAQGVGEGLGVREDVLSPTFVLVAEYEGRFPLLHADVYRLSEEELPGIGLEEMLEDWPGLALIEWADKFPEILPISTVSVQIQFSEHGRLVCIEEGSDLCVRWRTAWQCTEGC